MKISQKLISRLEEMKKFPINNSELCQQYIQAKGLMLFEDLAEKLEKYSQNLDQNDKSEKDGVKFIHGEKFSINEDHDFKEWEKYDIVHLKSDKKEKGTIDIKTVPSYIRNDLTVGPQQSIEFNMISEVKCGQKAGRKLSDSDSRWVEKWYEIKCKDLSGSVSNNVVSDIIVKFYTKFWVNIQNNEIEGESLTQVLVDGSSGFHHDGLIYELKDCLSMENVLKKTGSLRIRKQVITKTVPIVHKIQDSKKEMVESMQKDIETIITGEQRSQQDTNDVPVFDIINLKSDRPSSRERSAQNTIHDVPKDIATNFKINVEKMETPSNSSKSISKAEGRSPGKTTQNTIIKYKEVTEEILVDDEYQNSNLSLIMRVAKLKLVRSFLTQFDGSQYSNKVKEEGVEHQWQKPGSTVVKTGIWTSSFYGKFLSTKIITYRETDKSKPQDPDTKSGEREGTNEHGQYWKEDWTSNERIGYLRWSNMTQEFKHLRNDGFESKWGEWREEQRGQATIGERWTELYKEDDDYWERKSERYTEYAKKYINDIDNALEMIDHGPRIIRSGISDFKNNRNYLKAEHWEEYVDGLLKKKIVRDDGYGKKEMEEQFRKLDLEKITDIQLVTDEQGYYMHFVDEEGNKFNSLQDLIESFKQNLEYEYKNITIDEIGNNKIIFIRKGRDFINDSEWDNSKEVNKKDSYTVVKNLAKDSGGEWTETWTNKSRERWTKKEGKRGGQSWNEQWYKKIKNIKKKDEKGKELDAYDSDAVEECNCQKWGRNEDAREEWNEKWGEVDRHDKREKWCDKWQIDLNSGLKKGENWGQIYTENYQIIEHWAEKWDDRHPENGGVYEKRHEHWPQSTC